MRTFLETYKIDKDEDYCKYIYESLVLQRYATLQLSRNKRWTDCEIQDDGLVTEEIIDDCEISERTGWYLKVNKAHDKVIGKWTHVKDTFFFLLDDGSRIYR